MVAGCAHRELSMSKAKRSFRYVELSSSSTHVPTHEYMRAQARHASSVKLLICAMAPAVVLRSRAGGRLLWFQRTSEDVDR